MQAVELQRAPLVAEGVREDAAVGMRLDEAGSRAPRQAAARPLRCVDVAMPVRCWLGVCVCVCVFVCVCVCRHAVVVCCAHIRLFFGRTKLR